MILYISTRLCKHSHEQFVRRDVILDSPIYEPRTDAAGLYRLKMADRSDSRVSLAHRNAKRRYSTRLRCAARARAGASTLDSASRVKEEGIISATARDPRGDIFHALFFRRVCLPRRRAATAAAAAAAIVVVVVVVVAVASAT
jgi:hypothetical protein